MTDTAGLRGLSSRRKKRFSQRRLAQANADKITFTHGAFGKANWDTEQSYELTARRNKLEVGVREKLPIRVESEWIHLPNDEGQEGESQIETSSDDEKSAVEANQKTRELNDNETADSETNAKINTLVEGGIRQVKERLAHIALNILEDSEANIGQIRELERFASVNCEAVQRLALLTLLSVFRDVIPGYRIRELSEAERKVKVSKEVKQVRDYEDRLVMAYKRFITRLIELARLDTRVGTTAVHCACVLLEKVSHFNFRGDLISIIVMQLKFNKTDKFNMCVHSLTRLFREDDEGQSSLDAVRAIVRFVKALKYNVCERVIDTLLHVRLLTDYELPLPSSGRTDQTNTGTTKVYSTRKRKENIYTSKNVRKRQRLDKKAKEVDREVNLRVQKEVRERTQSEILRLIFSLYLNILKRRKSSGNSMMGSVLEGLVRFAHLINQEYFEDVMEVLRTLNWEYEDDSSQGRSEGMRSVHRLLLCIVSAFALHEKQIENGGKSVNGGVEMDLSHFVCSVFKLLLAVCVKPELKGRNDGDSRHIRGTDGDDDDVKDGLVNMNATAKLLVRSLSYILLPVKRGKAWVPRERLAAFVKRMFTTVVNISDEQAAVAVLTLLREVSAKEDRSIASLWFASERKRDGRYNGAAESYETSNPFAGTVWENGILQRHFSPVVREVVTNVNKIICDSRK